MMVPNAAVILLLLCVFQGWSQALAGKQLPGDRVHLMQNPTTKLVDFTADNLASNFLGRALSITPVRNSELDETILGKASQSHLVVGEDRQHVNSGILRVPQGEEWMVERNGKFSRTAKPGLNFAIPVLESVAYKRSMRETALLVHPQPAITKDNVHVKLDGAVYCQVVDSHKASYGLDDPIQMITTLAQSAMRKQVGHLDLDELFKERERLSNDIAMALDEETKSWGIHVLRYEIADISVGASTQQAMERQSNAERVRRAEVIESEGHRQKMINESEGAKQAATNKAQGEAESMRVKAEAEARTIKMLAEAEAEKTRATAQATADGIAVVAKSMKIPGAEHAMAQRLAEQYVAELSSMAQNSQMIIVPDKPNDVPGVVGAALGMANSMANSIKAAKLSI